MRVERAAFGVEELSGRGHTGGRLREVTQVTAVLVAWGVNQRFVHAPGAHVDVALVRVKTVTVVPVDPIKSQSEAHEKYQPQTDVYPGKSTDRGGKAYPRARRQCTFTRPT